MILVFENVSTFNQSAVLVFFAWLGHLLSLSESLLVVDDVKCLLVWEKYAVNNCTQRGVYLFLDLWCVSVVPIGSSCCSCRRCFCLCEKDISLYRSLQGSECVICCGHYVVKYCLVAWLSRSLSDACLRHASSIHMFMSSSCLIWAHALCIVACNLVVVPLVWR